MTGIKSNMKFPYFTIFIVVVVLLDNLYICKCASANTQNRSLADNYTVLTEDVKWFFRGVSKIANTMDQMLPNATVDLAKTPNFTENTRITFLLGLHHLLVGVREIAITFEKSFNTDHVKQLYQLKIVTQFVNDVINVLKMWLSRVRAMVMYILLLYNHYLPEVLFGKCLGHYLVTTYPERNFYEYPLILLTEVYSSIIINFNTVLTDSTELSTELPIFDTDLNMEQNEISNADFEDAKDSYGENSTRLSANNSTTSSQSFESLIDFSTVLSPNKEQIIENAAAEQSWQICLKFYTAESISRSLKIYFLGL